MFRRLVLSAVLGMALSIPAHASIPRQIGYVNDFAKVLLDVDVRSLNYKAASIRRSDGDRPQVITILPASLGGTDIESYAQEVFKAWKIGQKGKDNGVLIVLAPNDKKIRIETGYGVEGFIPDSVAKDILDKMLPLAAHQNYAQSVDVGLTEIGKLYDQESATKLPAKKGDAGLVFFLLPFGAIGVIGLIAIWTGIRRRRKEAERKLQEAEAIQKYANYISEQVKTPSFGRTLPPPVFSPEANYAPIQPKPAPALTPSRGSSFIENMAASAVGSAIGNMVADSFSHRSHSSDSRSDDTPSGWSGGGGSSGGGGASSSWSDSGSSWSSSDSGSSFDSGGSFSSGD